MGENMNSSLSHCKSNSDLKTQCRSNASYVKLSGDNLNEEGCEMQNLELAAQNEIFSWSQEDEDNRKGSLTSINIECPINKFENEENFEEIGGISFNAEAIDSPFANDSYSDKDSVSFADHLSYENTYDDLCMKDYTEKVGGFDLLDLSDDNNDDTNAIYDFELDIGMHARKTIVN